MPTEPPALMPQKVRDFRVRTIMPDDDVDALWTDRPGFLEALIDGTYQEIYSRLRKRYRVPFDPQREIVVQWMVKIATPEAYRSRGFNPSDGTIERVDADRDRAREQIKEAADATEGLYDLPLIDGQQASAVTTSSGPLGYSEPSPYDWTDAQREALYGRS